MKLFPHGHATHPSWEGAAALVLAQIRGKMAQDEYAKQPNLGVIYITDHYSAHAKELLDLLITELPEVTEWVGTAGIGIASNQVEYHDEPALAIMLCQLPADQYRVFNGISPLPNSKTTRFSAHTVLMHADPATAELPDLIQELSQRTTSGNVFGGLTLSRSLPVQFAWSGRDLVKDDEATTIGVYQGGLSGVAFGEQISIVNRVSQGCRPIGPTRTITACDDHIILEIDHHPALEILLQDLEIDLQKPQAAMLKLRSTLVGVTQPQSAIVNKSGEFGESAWIRHIIGIDPSRKAVAITDQVKVGEKMAFCQRNQAIARADLLRIGAEIRETLDPFLALNSDLILTAAGAFPVQPTQKEPQIAGAIYISCSGRGGAYFGGPSAELQLVARALGDVPLVGFFAAGEIAHQNIHAYTGILTVFTNH